MSSTPYTYYKSLVAIDNETLSIHLDIETILGLDDFGDEVRHGGEMNKNLELSEMRCRESVEACELDMRRWPMVYILETKRSE
jgi:hypothetical protein